MMAGKPAGVVIRHPQTAIVNIFRKTVSGPLSTDEEAAT